MRAVHTIRTVDNGLRASRFLLNERTPAADALTQTLQHRNGLFPGDARVWRNCVSS